MSTATRFTNIGYWPAGWCGNYPAPLSSYSGSTNNLIGPFTLSEVMALYWNMESITVTSSIETRTVTDFNPPSNYQPNTRVCGGFFNYPPSGVGDGVHIFATSQIYYDTSNNYYFRVLCSVYSPTIAGVGSIYFQTLDPMTSAYYSLDHTFTGYVFGKSVTVKCYKLIGSYPAWPYSDTFTVTNSYFTY